MSFSFSGYILNIIASIYKIIFLNPNPSVSCKNVILRGIPLIDIRSEAKLEIGDNVLLNSRNKGYHLNMYGPVKLMADRPGAVIKIGKNSRIHGSCIHSFSRIELGENCLIAANCQIMDANGHEMSFSDVSRRNQTRDQGKAIAIGDNVWLGTGVIVLPGVTIGSGSVIGAGSVVSKDIPPMCFAAGVPAKVIKSYT